MLSYIKKNVNGWFCRDVNAKKVHERRKLVDYRKLKMIVGKIRKCKKKIVRGIVCWVRENSRRVMLKELTSIKMVNEKKLSLVKRGERKGRDVKFMLENWTRGMIRLEKS